MARPYELTTPLGPDVLLFRAMRGREELGRSPEWDLWALSTRGDINPGDLLGKSVTVAVALRGGGQRYFNYYVVRVAQGTGLVGRYHEYRLTLRPWLWFLTRTTDCRIFQEKTVPDIVKEVFADHPAVAVFDDGLTGTYCQREYCVQYRETDFDFLSRLLEEEGIYYYYEHEAGRHTLKLVDSYSGHKALTHQATIPYYPPGRDVHAGEEYVHGWSCAQGIQPGAAAMREYDFTRPKADLAVKANLLEPHEQADYEWFEYPGEYRQTADGEHYARARIDEFHAQFELAEAACNVRDIAVGRLFTLANAPRRDHEREYLIISADYDLRDNAYETTPTAGAEYACTLTALQSRQQFRPARLTPRPHVQGPQTAVVVGPGGEEIWCDKYGRVKVQFHWDRYGKKNENSSCWIRVSQPWAGGAWGAMAIPRMGQEVVVDFLEGDPDQPLITGRVYNADQMPPYALPANKTQTGIKSRSSLGGGAANFNEIRFEDKKGAEQLTIHAEKNQDITVENDETHSVGHDRSKSIGHDETTSVGNNRTEAVGVNEDITIGANRNEKVGANETIAIGSNRSVTIGANKSETIAVAKALTIGAGYQVSVGGAMNETIGGLKAEEIGGAKVVAVGVSSSENVGANKSVNAGGNISDTAGANISASAGSNISEAAGANFSGSAGSAMSFSSGADYSVNSKAKVLIVAASELTLKCGGASIVLRSGGEIVIKGSDISVQGSGKIGVKATGDLTLKGSKIGEN
jgi:type VI secretion system secreted protein VgrG